MGSDEEEEDGDDEEDVEKGGGTECDEGTGGKEEQMVVDIESGPAPAQEGSIGQDGQEGREEISQAAEDDVILCKTGKTENYYQTQNNKEKVDKSVTEQQGQSAENKKVLTKAGNENSESISVNTNPDSHMETERDTWERSNTETSGKTNSQKLTETENNNKVVTVEEAEQNSPTEPMEVEATETATTDISEAVRGEDTGTGWIFTLSHTSSLAL